MCSECNNSDNGIDEANKWAEQYFGGLTQPEQVQENTWPSIEISEAMRVPPGGGPGGSPGGGGIVVPPGGGPGKKKHPPIIIPPGGSPGEGRGEGDEPERLYWIWVTEGGACEICLDNEDAGPIIQYDTFPDGSVAPPAHPNCRCHLEEINPTQWDPKYKAPPGEDIGVWYGPQNPGEPGAK